MHITIEGLNENLDKLNQDILSSKIENLLTQVNQNSLIFSDNLDSKLVKPFMDELKARRPELFIFGVFKQVDKLNMACYCSKDWIEKGLKAGQVVKEAAQLADGNGGGKPDFAQAGAKNVDKAEECLQFVKEKVMSLL